MVKAAVLVKQVPDTEEVRIDPKTRTPDASRASRVLSLYDKNAVEAAVQLKENGQIDEVVAISLGDDKVEETLREVLAMGADQAIAIKEPELLNGGTLGKSQALAKAVEGLGDIDIVFASEESADSHTASTGPMVAEFLDANLLSYVFDIEVTGDGVQVDREIDEGIETLKASFPAVITVVEAINDPRLPALMQILQAKNKPLENKSAEDLGVATTASINIVENVAPEQTRKQEISDVSDPAGAASELVSKLKKEGVL
ncbi:MAG: electron transfer flavoprotein subunit beta/FixA family protein [Candidatus Thermoplasmatota archaeon]|nr:electron transfer flavoprotein subunit beta/FixA family protein [Candidatus Thermoplasmatota archaeon]